MTDDLRQKAKTYRQFGDLRAAKSFDRAADRIEKLEAALRTVKEWHGYGLPPETTRMIDAALEGKDD